MVNIKKKNEKNNVNIDANVGVNKILVNDLESLDKLIEKVNVLHKDWIMVYEGENGVIHKMIYSRMLNGKTTIH